LQCASRRSSDLGERASGAAALVDSLGGLTEVTRANGGQMIQRYACPLAEVSAAQPEVCRLVETMLAEVTGGEVRELCDGSWPPHCRFAITAHDD
jgi:predicted ArsR family transcriptional regulator